MTDDPEHGVWNVQDGPPPDQMTSPAPPSPPVDLEKIRGGYVWMSPTFSCYVLCPIHNGWGLVTDPREQGSCLKSTETGKDIFSTDELVEMFSTQYSKTFERGWTCEGQCRELFLAPYEQVVELKSCLAKLEKPHD